MPPILPDLGIGLSPELIYRIGIAVLIGVLVGLVLVHHAEAMRGRFQMRLRPLPPLNVIRAALGRGAETGHAIHVSPGAGTVGDRASTAETIVGLLAAERVVNEAGLKGAPILASSGDAAAYMALLGILRQAYQRAGQGQNYDPQSVQLLAHQDATAYAVGVTTLYGRQQLEASQMFGSFGQEFLLVGEDGAQRAIPQVVGATSTGALPVMLLSTPNTLIGEEIFAAEAYLSDDLASQARLRTQDALRNGVIALIIVGVIYALLQPVLGLPPLPGS